MKTLGPVRDLAAHVPVDWWRGVFNALYLKTDGDVVDDAAITRREVDSVIAILGLRPDDRILDLCCGQGRHALELARRGFSAVEGLDQSAYLLDRARDSARRERLPVRFLTGDARELGALPGPFHAVLIMGNSFGYFDSSAEDLRVLREVRERLRPDGRLFLDISDGDQLRARFEPRSWEWIDARMFVCRERTVSADGRMVSREIITDTETGVICDQFYAERLYTRDELAALIESAGFTNFTVHREVASHSERNQDLGMMAHRLFVTATVGPASASKRARGSDLVVVMGDPSQPDPIKLDRRFGAPDLEAIERMRSALAEHHGTRPRYLSDHAGLLDELRRLDRSALVVNLCDEGLGNRARDELHIPALLDALGLAYTGAGPQCLARCYDKALVRGLARELGIPVANATLVGPGDPLPAITGPVLVKPNHGDGSFGIDAAGIARDASQLGAAIAAVRELAGRDAVLLVERWLDGKELSLGILGNPPGPHRVLPIVEEDYSMLSPELPRICGYRAKWDPGSPYWQLRSIPADIPEDLRRSLVAWSLRLFTHLECRDYARIDWRLDETGAPFLLEVNPNPGWCWDGHLAKMAALAGLSYADLLGAVIVAGEERLGRRRVG